MATEKLTTDPVVEPLTTAEAKAHLNVTTNIDDTYINTLVAAAREYAEEYTGRALYDQTWTHYRDGFAGEIQLQRSPVLAVTSIKYLDTASPMTQQTLASTVYRVDAINGCITRNYGESWPTVRNVTNSVEIEYRVGYVNTGVSPITGTAPASILHAIKLMIGHWYMNRESVVIGTTATIVPMAVHDLLFQRRTFKS